MTGPATRAALLVAALWMSSAAAEPPYRIQPGDVLTVAVWKEPELSGDALVRPDGGLSLPLVGEVEAGGRTVEELRSDVASRIERYLPSPSVTVAVRQLSGSRIFVVGKVNRPGEFPLSQPIDVMQALSLAGGTTAFAALNDILVLRREPDGSQQAIRFRYTDVERGRSLEQNVLLQSGDTLVVP